MKNREGEDEEDVENSTTAAHLLSGNTKTRFYS